MLKKILCTLLVELFFVKLSSVIIGWGVSNTTFLGGLKKYYKTLVNNVKT